MSAAGGIALPVARPLRRGTGWAAMMALALFHGRRPAADFMVTTAYLDESGTHGGSPALVMSAFLGDAQQWEACETEFRGLYAAEGVRVFHDKDFHDTEKDFEGWPRARKADFNARFLRITDETLAFGCVVALPRERYRAVYRAGRMPKRSRPDTEYGLVLPHLPLPRAALHARPAPFRTFRSITGASSHPVANVISAGPADPPYVVAKLPLESVLIDDETLRELRGLHVRRERRTVTLGL